MGRLHFRRVRAGDSVDDAIEITQPIKVTRVDRWTILSYQGAGHFTGMMAAAYDGRMVFAYAQSCCWTKVFFDEMSDEQSVDFFGRPKDDPRRLGFAENIYR